MVSTLLAVVLSAGAPTLAALELEAQQVPPAVAKLVSTQLTQRLTLRGLKVVTPSDVTALLGVERQKQLMGCGDDTSCLAELGAALDAAGVLSGSVGQLGSTTLLNVRVVSTRDARALAVCSAKAAGEDALLAEAEACADAIVAALLPGASPPAVARRTWALAPLLAGAALAVTGGVLWGVSGSQRASIAGATQPPPDVFATARTGEALGTAGFVCAGVGVAAAVAGAALYFTGGAAVQPTALLTPHGGYVGVSGVWP